VTDFDVVWQRIVMLQAETFYQKTGKPFTYAISGGCVVPSTTNRQLARSQFARAYERVPLRGPGELQDLQGPSYLFAILADARVAAGVHVAAGAAGAVTPRQEAARSLASGRRETGPELLVTSDALSVIDPQRALLVVTCSAAKARGGQPPGAADEYWPPALRAARSAVLAGSESDASRLLPAWRRYTGTFYQYARPALTEAVAAGHVIIISGGYGLARAEEPIGWYDNAMRPADWPAGLIESALIGEARRSGAETVVAFASSTTGYARLLRRAPWHNAGIAAHLVTIAGVSGGAMVEVPRRLGLAFSAFWNKQHDAYPPGTIVEQLG
jgi:hypothetical protein